MASGIAAERKWVSILMSDYSIIISYVDIKHQKNTNEIGPELMCLVTFAVDITLSHGIGLPNYQTFLL